jgi:hypothetical protein
MKFRHIQQLWWTPKNNIQRERIMKPQVLLDYNEGRKGMHVSGGQQNGTEK